MRMKLNQYLYFYSSCYLDEYLYLLILVVENAKTWKDRKVISYISGRPCSWLSVYYYFIIYHYFFHTHTQIVNTHLQISARIRK